VKILLLTFALLVVINFVGAAECSDWKKDEKYWFFAMLMSIAGFFTIIFRMA